MPAIERDEQGLLIDFEHAPHFPRIRPRSSSRS